jgi:integrase
VAFDPTKGEYTRKELAKLLGVSVHAITPMIRLHKLDATGENRKRRYPRSTAEALLAMRSRGKSIKTSNGYLAAIKQFCHWLVQDRRTGDNPLAHLSGGNVKLDRRHDRRALSSEELTSLLKTALASRRTLRGMDGTARYFLYLTAMTTGYRAGELASLTPESFALHHPATVNLSAGFTKNKKAASQPIPPVVAQALAGFLTSKPAGVPVWPGTWADDPVEMLRPDLSTAGISYAIDGPDGPLFADFHALRHSYIALLDKAGATLKEAMQLARHSDPKLTMAVYGRAQLHDLAATVEGLPVPSLTGPASLAATGTEGAPRPRLDQTGAASCGPVGTGGESEAGDHEAPGERKSLRLLTDEERCEGVSESDESSPSLTRIEPCCWPRPRKSRNSSSLRMSPVSYPEGARRAVVTGAVMAPVGMPS